MLNSKIRLLETRHQWRLCSTLLPISRWREYTLASSDDAPSGPENEAATSDDHRNHGGPKESAGAEEPKGKEIKVCTSSLRVDNVAAAGLGTSRM